MKKLGAFLVGLGLVAPSSVWAAEYGCGGGTVSGVSFEATSGDVLVERIAGATADKDLNWPRLCSVKVAANSISPEACKAVYSTLLTAQTTGKKLTVNINNGLTCATNPAWQFVPGFYFLSIK